MVANAGFGTTVLHVMSMTVDILIMAYTLLCWNSVDTDLILLYQKNGVHDLQDKRLRVPNMVRSYDKVFLVMQGLQSASSIGDLTTSAIGKYMI